MLAPARDMSSLVWSMASNVSATTLSEMELLLLQVTHSVACPAQEGPQNIVVRVIECLSTVRGISLSIGRPSCKILHFQVIGPCRAASRKFAPQLKGMF